MVTVGVFSGTIPNNYYTTTFAEELKKLQVNSTAPMKLDPLHVLPVPNKNLYPVYPWMVTILEVLSFQV